MHFVMTGVIYFCLVGVVELAVFLLRPGLSWGQILDAMTFVISAYGLAGWVFGAAVWAGTALFGRKNADDSGRSPLRSAYLSLLVLLTVSIYGVILSTESVGVSLSFLHPKRLALTGAALLAAALAAAAAYFLHSRLRPGHGRSRPAPDRRRLILAALLPLFLAGSVHGLLEFMGSSGEEISGNASPAAFSRAAEPSEGPLNLLLITLDTTRADHLGTYGNRSVSTPYIDALASGGATFLDAHSISPRTAPSHASLFSGLYPQNHGIRWNGQDLDLEIETLAETLAKHGYATGGVVSSHLLTGAHHFDQGFEYFADQIPELYTAFRNKEYSMLLRILRRLGIHDRPPYPTREASQVADMITGWIEERGDRPFFAWAHIFDAHDPYAPPLAYYGSGYHPNTGTSDRLEALLDGLSPYRYDGEIAFADAAVGLLLTRLTELDLLDDTLIVILADHGEGLGEHDYNFHANRIYIEQTRIPLIFWKPGLVASGRRLEQLVEIVDVHPTILDLLGIGRTDPAALDGVSLARWAMNTSSAPEGPVKDEAYSEALGKGNQSSLFSLITPKWKLILDINSQSVELFDRAEDPGQLRNLAAGDPMTSGQLLARLNRRISLKSLEDAEDLDPETLEQLKALGYVY